MVSRIVEILRCFFF